MDAPARRLPRRPPPTHPSWLAVLDVLVLGAALVAVVWLRGAPFLRPWLEVAGIQPGPGLGGWNRNESALLVFQVATILPILHGLGAFTAEHAPRAWRFIVAVLSSLGVLSVLLVVLRQEVPRATLLADYALILVGLYLVHAVMQARWQRAHRRHGPLRLVMVGPPVEGIGDRRMVTRLVDGTLDDEAFRVAARDDAWPAQVAVVADDVPRVLDAAMPEEIILGAASEEVRRAVMAYCELHGIPVAAALPIRGGAQLPQPRRVGDVFVVDLNAVPMRRIGWLVKRSMDVVGAVVGLVVFLPVILVAAAAIKIEDRRLPLFYGGTRVGLKGHRFSMWKFNTMRRDAQAIEERLAAENEREGPWFKLEQDKDPRLTRVGRFLRKYSLNEIPQFWNILVGDMSLVGPRPPTPDEVSTYVQYDTRYFQCLDVKPGLTGLWQVTAKNDPSFDRRIDLDVQYIRNWSLGLDCKILLQTLWSVLHDTE